MNGIVKYSLWAEIKFASFVVFETKLFQHEEKRLSGEEVPYEISDKDLVNITRTHNRNGTKKYIDYIMGVEIQKLKQLRKKRYSMHNEKFEIERNSDDVISLFKQVQGLIDRITSNKGYSLPPIR